MNVLQGKVYVFGPYRLDPGRRTVVRKGQTLSLTPKEFDTLLVLVENGGEVVGKDTLVSRVWPDTFVGDSSLTRNISVLRKALGEGVIETAPKHGYRLKLPVQVLEKEACNAPPPAPVSSGRISFLAWRGQDATPRFGGGAQVMAAFAVALALGISLYVHSRESGGRDAASSRQVRVAILPVLNLTGDSSQEYLCDGLTEAMISELSSESSGHLRVIDRKSVMPFKAANNSGPDIGRVLKVHYVVESSVRTAGSRWRVSTQLVRTSDARVIWSGEFERKLKDVLNMQHEMAVAIARRINLRLADST